MSEKSAVRKIFDVQLLRRVLTYASPYKKKFYISLALAILLAVLSPLRPYLIQLTLNDFVRQNQPVDIQTELIRTVVLITVFQIVLLIIESAMRFYFSFLTAVLGQSVVKDLRVKVYKKVLGLNLSQFDKTPIGTLTTHSINDIESINEIFSEGLIPIIADLLSIVSVLAYMFWVDWRLTLISLAPFPFLIMATYVFKESVNRSFITVRNAVASLNAFV